MATITIEVPDELSEQLAQLGDRLPDLLRQCLVSRALRPTGSKIQVNFLRLDDLG